ncbi:cupin domain-containing protein [Anaeromyxobacter paludicola]|uniref:Cupin n=1 Tax=Anaeromyxobacter paludicola TaxID=2918171 RepID=A0ABM7XD73_9BACT|nr:cupin domain-containing protein [Anaeromyxobacter paludicola]BDG09832.1 cupin [Anaeromyxobacter paludicola]
MAKLMVKQFSQADERRPFQAHGRVELVDTGEGMVGRAVFEPGWRWSADVKPLAGTRTCEVAHSGYVLSGRMHLVMDDGEERDIGPGDYVVIPPGHDGWTLGDEPCVFLDFAGAANYARAQAGSRAQPGASGAEAGAPMH